MFLFLFSAKGYTGQDGVLYGQAVREVKLNRPDFAFMKFNAIVELFPNSKYFERALFAVGEYNFKTANYYDAALALRQFILKYPKSRAKLFALVYLLEIYRKQKDQNSVIALEKEIVSFWQFSLLFRNCKIYKYKSPFSNVYKALYFIDKVEIYIDDKLLAKVSF